MPTTTEFLASLAPTDTFVRRHLGPRDHEITEMLAALDLPSMAALIEATVPTSIRASEPLTLADDLAPERQVGEREALAALRGMMGKNRILRSLIGLGYYGCVTPPVIQRNILENPGWYTQYTPYQAEISQGRLEALLVFQTMIADLTGLPLCGASLLDEATAAAEAMTMCVALSRGKRRIFVVDGAVFPQTFAVLESRAQAVGIEIRRADPETVDFSSEEIAGVLVQYPDASGAIRDFHGLCERAHGGGALVVMAADLLALALLRSPGELGADIAVGSAQRFGVPMGFGGPHAGFIAARDRFKRALPGRIIGVTHDASGQKAYRMALQTREQHIRRERATSNICTSQVLLAIMAAMYGVYHGPAGIRRIATRVHGLTALLAAGLGRLGYGIDERPFFDTLTVATPGDAQVVHDAATAAGFNLRPIDCGSFGIALDEVSTTEEVQALLGVFAAAAGATPPMIDALAEEAAATGVGPLARQGELLRHPIFSAHHGEHGMLRYLRRLEGRDLSLTTSMIPLGSCTMKLNATSEMLAL
ncbi:MAG TPA: glycine dehydrogenase (aminomethyl-transferring), partial [Nannocystis exedens]|nr:glycine dehydrogenase (aminomethyl-transferring) [Nannocystis exedens]